MAAYITSDGPAEPLAADAAVLARSPVVLRQPKREEIVLAAVQQYSASLECAAQANKLGFREEFIGKLAGRARGVRGGILERGCSIPARI